MPANSNNVPLFRPAGAIGDRRLHALAPGFWHNAVGNRTPALCGHLVEMPNLRYESWGYFGSLDRLRRFSLNSRGWGQHRPRGDYRSRPLRRRARRTSMDAYVCRGCRKAVLRMKHPRWTGPHADQPEIAALQPAPAYRR
jgi:hypothetical protein